MDRGHAVKHLKPLNLVIVLNEAVTLDDASAQLL